MRLCNAGATLPGEMVSGSTQASCAACGEIFSPSRQWQRFCGALCRRNFHARLTPEALRKDLEELRKRVEELEKR